MIIPIRCMTCGNILASKYLTYKKLLTSDKLILKDGILYSSDDSEYTKEEGEQFTLETRKQYITDYMENLNKKINEKDDIILKKPIESMIMKQVGVTRYCCKRHLIGHVDILNIL